ncbi:hypothetical protein CERZMDRAFT_95489 [Cercospora zeae-maydis SCOH1-5]|uniref:Amidohydrolase-related domain-containing protein n=1 Tax=Cercospora zeae-maydis SCOH1-5 TaxID=717836 RepID=A0A6A6FL97_9PEZI|nr:hypothetical protein CERZMDRAFT_95489 [Cercospora zeae-maydis SCOH1-5]
MAAERATIEDLRRVIRTFPVIDNHAHNLLHTEQLKREDFLSATGSALHDHVTALPHLRAPRQLRELYGLPREADWDAILSKRQELLDQDSNGLIKKKCLAGTQTILMDDGLIGDFHPYDWHDQFVASPCKRIVRVEAIASEILYGLHKAEKLPIVAYLEDDAVVDFKSVICYRTGLDIEFGSDLEVSETALNSSYPYTREAEYWATVYKNVSRDGQEHIIRPALEITPASDLSADEAVVAVKRILLEISNDLYQLGLELSDGMGEKSLFLHERKNRLQT